MKKIPLDEDSALIWFQDGSTGIQYKGNPYDKMSEQEREDVWSLALRKGVIKRPGMMHINNLTSFGVALGKLLQ